MAKLPAAVAKLMTAFERLPGIGQKTAARLTFYLLNVPQEFLEEFGTSLIELRSGTMRCSECANIDETNPCRICTDPTRDKHIICVVERPLDLIAFEKTGKYRGVYHILHGSLAPLDNIGPDELTIALLLKRVRSGTITELILATNTSLEGEATAMYIANRIGELTTNNLQPTTKMKVTRLAHGLPIGGDIEYADEVTLTKALEGRREY